MSFTPVSSNPEINWDLGLILCLVFFPHKMTDGTLRQAGDGLVLANQRTQILCCVQSLRTRLPAIVNLGDDPRTVCFRQNDALSHELSCPS